MNDARLPRILSLLVAGTSLSLMLAALGGCDGVGGRSEATTTTLALDPDADRDADRDPNRDPNRDADRDAGEVRDAGPEGTVEDAPLPPTFTAERLEQMVAPIALYPDALLMEILMAATYPAEVAEAAAWVKEHPGLTGKELDDAIAEEGWDVSVNSLTHAPKALELMAADPEWTRDLGDAFLAQQDDVLNAVQVMRSKACDTGTLKTTDQQEVIIEEAPPRPAEPAPGPVIVAPPPRIVRIVPVQPNVFYVPVYNPRVVFGVSWPTIYYPRAYLYPSISVGVAPVISFGVGLTIGALLWSDADWYYGRVYRHHHHYDHRRDYYRYGQPRRGDYWRHDSHHRRHVSYRNREVERIYRPSEDGRRDDGRFRDGDRRDSDRREDRMGDRGPGGGGRDGRGGGRDDGRRDSDRSRGDSRELDRDRGQRDSRDKSSAATRDRMPGNSRGERAAPGKGPSKGPARIEDRSRGGATKSPGVSGKGPGSGRPERPDKGPAMKQERSSKPGGPSYRPPGGDKRGGSSSQRPPSGGGGSSYRPQGGDKRGGPPQRPPSGGGGSSYRPPGGDKRGGGSMQQGGRGGGGSPGRGGGQQQKGGGKSQRGGDDKKGGGKQGGR